MKSSPFGCSRIGDYNPKIDGFFTSKFFIIPAFFNPDSSTGFNSNPRILITNFKCFMLRLFFQLENNFAFNLAISFSEFSSFGWSEIIKIIWCFNYISIIFSLKFSWNQNLLGNYQNFVKFLTWLHELLDVFVGYVFHEGILQGAHLQHCYPLQWYLKKKFDEKNWIQKTYSWRVNTYYAKMHRVRRYVCT